MSSTWPPSPPPPPESPPPRPARPPGRGRTAVAVTLVVALIAGMVATAAVTDRPPSSPAVTPTAPGEPAEGAGPADLDTAVEEAMAFVEEVLQREFKEVPEVDVLADEAFVERFDGLMTEDLERDPERYETATAVYQALGILPMGTSFLDAQRSFGATGVLGFYHAESGSLTVRAGEVTPFARTVLVHELTHALDDQWFGLHRPEYDDATDEVGFALVALAEGNARRVEQAFRASLTAAERLEHDREQAGHAARLDLEGLTVSFLLLQLAPYRAGEVFVEELVRHGGEEALARAFEDTPRTSREVLEIETYLGGFERVEVPPPPAGGPVIDEGVFGQIALQAILEPVLGPSMGREATRGWAGDWFVAWMDGANPCLRARFAMEGADELGRLARALDRWAETRPASEADATGAHVTLTSCGR